MEERIRGVTQKGRVPEEIRTEHKGFSEWLPGMSSRDHPSIVQILIDGRDPAATDAEGRRLPTLVYVAREKRPQYHHNFKAGAMNCLVNGDPSLHHYIIIIIIIIDGVDFAAEGIFGDKRGEDNSKRGLRYVLERFAVGEGRAVLLHG